MIGFKMEIIENTVLKVLDLNQIALCLHVIFHPASKRNNYTGQSDANGGWRRHVIDAHASEVQQLLLPMQPALRMPVGTINARSADTVYYSTCMPDTCTREDLKVQGIRIITSM